MKKRRRKKSRQGKRYSQINFVSTSRKNRAPALAQGLDPQLFYAAFNIVEQDEEMEEHFTIFTVSVEVVSIKFVDHLL